MASECSSAAACRRPEGRPSLLPRPPAHPSGAGGLPGRPPCLCSGCRGLALAELKHLFGVRCQGSWGGLHSLAGSCWDLTAARRAAPTPCSQAGPRLPWSRYPPPGTPWTPRCWEWFPQGCCWAPPLDWNPQQDALGAPLTCTHLALFGGFFVPGADALPGCGPGPGAPHGVRSGVGVGVSGLVPWELPFLEGPGPC